MIAVVALTGWLYWQVSIADAVLDGTASLRQGVRSTYRSAGGYGPDGAPPRGDWSQTMNLRQQGWADAGGGMLAGPHGLRLQVLSRVRAFEVELTGVPSLACRLAVRFMDEGWAEIRVGGVPVAPQPGGGGAAAGCGWWGRATLGLTSAG